MEKKEKIILVLGNGFDLDLGFKTSYFDFANKSGFWPKCKDSALWHFLDNQKKEQGKNGAVSKPRWKSMLDQLLRIQCLKKMLLHIGQL